MLRDYIKEGGVDRAGFADALGITRGFLSLLEGGKRQPSLDLALRIARLTGGAVPVESWEKTQRGKVA